MEESLWVVTATVVVVFAIAKLLKKSSSISTMEWPKGPKKLPIIGNLHQLGGEAFHVVLANLAKIHGTVMTIWVGAWRPMIVISDIDKAWEVLVNKSSDYAGRDFPEITKIISANWKNISCSDSGPFWQNLRKGLQGGALAPLNVISQYQLQERDMKNLITSMQEKASKNNGILKPLDYLKEETIRLLSRLIFGQSFNDENFVKGVHLALDDLVRISGYASLADAFKFCENLPSHKKSIREVHEVNERVVNLVKPYLVKNPPTNTYLYFLNSQKFSDEVIISAVLEVYDLGVDSTASTAVWALTFLVREPRVQEKLYKEIIDLTGGERSVKVEDVSKLPYLQAVMKETMRMKPIAPMAIPHKTSRDTSLMGKKVNKGTSIMVNLYAIHHNPKVFPEPYKFIPERFLQGQESKYGDIKEMEQSLLPFSAGMRICAGMELGKLQYGFSLASLVEAFKWTCAVDGKLPDLSEDHCFILLMKNPLEARITPRTQL
uniref:Cheilanthifoline synthase n=1 Tax=Eschscholzia californica TaxID=3467 RepID=C7195_ESCCA|nr:RecName: Full=Cheilanthifoline synthase; Short=CHS; AltName: Full=Cytochrome P450 719A5 [Eschscholzia californica]ANY58153.1 CYP719A5 [synthetic construct]BAG75113.1 cheilanthifoline synthase [Eschscholzia californica]